MSQEYEFSLFRLRKWVRANIGNEAFASALGVSVHSLSFFWHDRKKGRRMFSAEQAEIIEELTQGEIEAPDLLIHAVPRGYRLVKIDSRKGDQRAA